MKIKMVFGVLVGFWLIAYTSYADELHKRDGSIIKGKIVEVIPNETYKIQASDGSIFVVKAEEVTKIVYNFPTVTNEELELRFNSLEGIIANAAVDLDKAYNAQIAGLLLSATGSLVFGVGANKGDEDMQMVGSVITLVGSVYTAIVAPIYGRRASSKLRQIEKYKEKTKDAELQQKGEKQNIPRSTSDTSISLSKKRVGFLVGALATAITIAVVLNMTD